MRKAIKLVAPVVGLSCALALAGCGSASKDDSSSSGKAAMTVTVALGDSPTSDLFMAGTATAPKFNEFKKRGLTVKTVVSGGAGKVNQLMAAGSADIGLTGAPGEASAIAKGLKAKIVAAVQLPYNQNVIVKKNSKAKAFGDLKGKTFGVTSIGSAGYYATVKLAQSQKWKVNSDIKIVPLGSVDSLQAALASGSIDSFIFGAQTAWQLEDKGIGRDLGSVTDVVGPTVFEGIYATDKLIKENPKALQAYLDGYFAGVKRLQADPSEFEGQLKTWKYSDSIAKRLSALDLPSLVSDGVIPEANLKGLADAVPVLNPSVSTPPSVDTIVDQQFVQANK